MGKADTYLELCRLAACPRLNLGCVHFAALVHFLRGPAYLWLLQVVRYLVLWVDEVLEVQLNVPFFFSPCWLY